MAGDVRISKNNKRIAVNTCVLYVRLLFTMLIAFFTTRIVLQALGVEDLGLVNAIGGVSSLFGFISISLSTACARYFSFEIGRTDKGRLGEVFSEMLLLYVVGGVILVVLLESIGGWYVLNKLVVPSGREVAAFHYFQLTIFTWLAGWFSVPYSALIVSYENMTLYALLSIADVGFKLVVAISVMLVKSVDSLMFYGWLLLIAAILHSGIYIAIARVKYPVCKYRFCFNKRDVVEMLSFNGWQSFGAFAWTTSDCCVNLLLNSFFGPVINAARLVAYQILTAVGNFTQGFLTAARPQIVKAWAAEERGTFYALLTRSSKIGYFLTFFFAMPLFIEADQVLKWWLGNPPEHSLAFTRIILIHALINTFSFPLVYAAQAVGKLALFNGLGSGVLLLTWPCSWLALRMGGPPESVFVIAVFVVCVAVVLRVVILARMAKLPMPGFLASVFGRMFVFSLVATAPALAIHTLLPAGFGRFLFVGTFSVVLMTGAFYLIGLDGIERRAVKVLVVNRLNSFGGRAR
ncbi:MAG: hypothetical protein K6G91_12810 [Kiritimatiellae bacterium]|nr:hypothetical protein [Kiritimatiellia bacterium]